MVSTLLFLTGHASGQEPTLLYHHPSALSCQYFTIKKGTPAVERTLSIIKPDGVAKNIIGDIIKRFETAGIKIAAIKMRQLTKSQAQGFYAVHRERPFFDSLTEFMTSGPIVVMVLEGKDVIAKNRKLMGATNFKDAEEGTIRREYATDIEKNVVHGSDAPETAAFEIGYFFNSLEIQAR
jgi:nucleoside-diphosphate kinase